MAGKLYKAILFAAVLSMMCGTAAYAKTPLSTGEGFFSGYSDFEDFNTGIAADKNAVYTNIKNQNEQLSNIWSIEKNNGNLITAIDETEDSEGNTTQALHFYVDGKSASEDWNLLLQPRPDISWNSETQNKYYVYTMNFKSGGDGCGYFKGAAYNWAESATVDWSTGKADFGSSANSEAFALDEWVRFTFIVDRTGSKDVQYMRFESSLGTREFTKTLSRRMTIKNSDPRWLMWLYGGSSKPDNPSLYIDDIEIYTTDYNITCDNAGAENVIPGRSIKLNVSGDVDEKSLSNIRVSSENGEESVESISLDNGICTVMLTENMADFTEYTVDFSDVCSITGLKKSFDPIKFTTSGKIELQGTVKLDKMKSNQLTDTAALERGIIQTTFTVKNVSSARLSDAVAVARLYKNGQLQGICYKRVSFLPNSEDVFRSAFLVPGDGYSIELAVQSSLNTLIYYTDIFTVSDKGIEQKKAENIENDLPLVSVAEASEGTMNFYDLTLGEHGARKEILKLTKGSMAECAANVGENSEAMLITTLKKDGAIIGLAYSIGASSDSVMHTALYVPEENGCTIDSFVWTDILGTKSFMKKSSLSMSMED